LKTIGVLPADYWDNCNGALLFCVGGDVGGDETESHGTQATDLKKGAYESFGEMGFCGGGIGGDGDFGDRVFPLQGA
jgi:hypothetical protein